MVATGKVNRGRFNRSDALGDLAKEASEEQVDGGKRWETGHGGIGQMYYGTCAGYCECGLGFTMLLEVMSGTGCIDNTAVHRISVS